MTDPVVDPTHLPAIQAIATKANSYTLAQSIGHDVHEVQQALIALKNWVEVQLHIKNATPTVAPAVPLVSSSIGAASVGSAPAPVVSGKTSIKNGQKA